MTNDVRATRREAHAEHGFTLIELLVVVVIIGILAGIALPVYLNQTDRAREGSVTSDLRNASIAAETYFALFDTYPANQADLETGGYIASPHVTLTMGAAAANTYCIQADHAELTPAIDGVFDSDDGGVIDAAPGC